MSFAGTGIAELDRLLGGGIRRSHSILLQADVGTLHERFLFSFMKEALDKGECVCYVSMDENVDTFIHKAKFMSPSIPEFLGKNLSVIDLQTSREVQLPDAIRNGVFTVTDPSNPSLVVAMTGSFLARLKAMEKNGVRYVANSLSGAIMTYGSLAAYKIIRGLLSFAKQGGFVGIGLIYPKMHTPQENATIEHAFDGVVELSTQQVGSRLQKYLQVKSMAGTKFSSEMVPYELVDEKIALWTRLVEDFEVMKKGMTLESDGTLRIMGSKGQFISERSLANLTSIILKEVGYEKGSKMLYEYTRASAGRTAEEISKVQRISGAELLKAYLKVSQMTGSGLFTHISVDEETGVASVRGVNLIPSTLKLDHQVHFRDAGAIAGVLEFAIGKPYKIQEARCVCKGDQYCEFIGKPT